MRSATLTTATRGIPVADLDAVLEHFDRAWTDPVCPHPDPVPTAGDELGHPAGTVVEHCQSCDAHLAVATVDAEPPAGGEVR